MAMVAADDSDLIVAVGRRSLGTVAHLSNEPATG